MISNELKDYVKEVFAVDYDEWIKDPRHFPVFYKDSLALFERLQTEKVVRGHYAFKSARGKQAVDHGTKILNIVFNNKGVETVVGLTPVTKKEASVMSRLLGFKFKETIDTPRGKVHMHYKTKGMHKNGLS